MKRLLCGLIFVGMAGLAPSQGDDPDATKSAVIRLFDGRSLDGWRPIRGTKVGKVEVNAGAINLPAGGPMTGVTTTRADLPTTNYRLTYEAQRTEGNDFFAAATFPVGSSFVTLVNGGWGGSVTGLSLINGESAAENTTNRFVKYQNNVWYRFEVQVTEQAIRCLVDDVEVVAYAHEGTQLKTRLETRVNEPLGFASYRSAGMIRRVEIKRLGPTEIAQIDAKVKTD